MSNGLYKSIMKGENQKEENMKVFKEARKLFGPTQEKFAAYMRVSRQTIWNWESGYSENNIVASVLKKLIFYAKKYPGEKIK